MGCLSSLFIYASYTQNLIHVPTQDAPKGYEEVVSHVLSYLKSVDQETFIS